MKPFFYSLCLLVASIYSHQAAAQDTVRIISNKAGNHIGRNGEVIIINTTDSNSVRIRKERNAEGHRENDVIVIETTDSDSAKTKKHTSISIGTGGIKVTRSGDSTAQKAEKSRFFVQYGMLDLGFLNVKDETNYASAETQAFLSNVPAARRNGSLFSLRESKSINVTIYPVLLKYKVVNNPKQKLYLSTGLALQVYNFRYNKPIIYSNETRPEIWMNDSINFQKNKLAVTYLTIPLMLTSKTKLAKGVTLVYGAGISAGYRISSWTKQKSEGRGKEKNHDPFNLENFNTSVQAEFGLDGIFRLYASYQLNQLFQNSLVQYPYSIGVRFLGI